MTPTKYELTKTATDYVLSVIVPTGSFMIWKDSIAFAENTPAFRHATRLEAMRDQGKRCAEAHGVPFVDATN